MKSQALEKAQWIAFAKDFSHAHEGWTASLEVREAGSPMRVEIDDSPFRGVTIEKRDRHDTVVLTFGYEPEEHFAHIVHDPRAIATAETDDRSAASLVVDSSDHARCVLALWNPMREDAFATATLRRRQ